MAERSGETHKGIVGEIEDDYSRVRLTTPGNESYERMFETNFLSQLGMQRAGDGVEVYFDTRVEEAQTGKEGVVEMRVRVVPQDIDQTLAKIRESVRGVDMDAVRRTFGSNM